MTSPREEREKRIRRALPPDGMTRLVKIEPGAAKEAGKVFKELFGDTPALLAADLNTFEAAGEEVLRSLAEAGCRREDPFIYQERDLHAETSRVEVLRKRLEEIDAVVLCVGSGTLNDLAKLASHQVGRPYMTVATAASVDGFTAYGASITDRGFKQTFYCPAPLALLADLEVIAAAPEGMNPSGYADLLAKIPAGADWILADALGAEAIHPKAWELVQGRLREWLADPEGVAGGKIEALGNLMEGLVFSGLAMQAARSSRAASGAEHLFSHLWDNQGHTYRGKAPSHGFKVGIGTLASSASYEKLLAMDPKTLETDPALLARRWPDRAELEARVRAAFPSPPALTEQVLEQSLGKYLTPEGLSSRLERFREAWPALAERLPGRLLPAAEIQDRLAAARAPSAPEEIGISRKRLMESYAPARMIRSRYTILDILAETGWWEECVETLFRPGGFFGQDAPEKDESA